MQLLEQQLTGLGEKTINQNQKQWTLWQRQPRTQASSRYVSYQRRRIFPTSLTGDVTPEITEGD